MKEKRKFAVLSVVLVLVALMPGYTHADGITINELVAGASSRMVQWSSNGVARIGSGPMWYTGDFDDSAWPTGPGGFGYGDGDDATDVESQMLNKTPSLYLRSDFQVNADTAASGQDLRLEVNYDDGFVAYLNGHEIARKNAGAYGRFMYCDQVAFNNHEAGTWEVIPLGAASDFLVEGTNLISVQVHNLSLDSSDLTIMADLTLAGAPETNVFSHTNTWRYFVGVHEPSGGFVDASTIVVGRSPDFEDWIELYNSSGSPVSLLDWSLSDNNEWPDKWVFPDVTMAAGAYMVVVCSGLDRRDPTNAFLHTNFKLDVGGEYLALFNAATQMVCSFDSKFPAQSRLHSYGWVDATDGWRFFPEPTPGTSNDTDWLTGIVDKPDFDTQSAFYSSVTSVVISCSTTGAVIRYTLDGSIPDESNSTIYTAPLNVSGNTAVRARAFKAGYVSSELVTKTFLVDVPAALSTLPAVCLVLDYERDLHRPHGVTAINGGVWSPWQPLTPDDYNVPMHRGRQYERETWFALIDPVDGVDEKAHCGIRLAVSDWSRPRVVYNDLTGWWTGGFSSTPQFNLYFRAEYGKDKINGQLFDRSDISTYESLRLRPGKNDINNPFVTDELCRRLVANMGQPSAVGSMANLFVNGEFKKYINPCERYVERFFQEHYDTDDEWDIISHGGVNSSSVSEGDTVRWEAMFAYVEGHDMGVASNYLIATSMVDVDSFIDYLLMNIYAAMWDWPENNWYAAAARSVVGRFGFYPWDAEGGFGFTNAGRRNENYDTFLSDLDVKPNEIPRLYRALYNSDVFRMRFAERIHTHFFGDGAMTDTNVLAEFTALADELDPIMHYMRGVPVSRSEITTWITHRRPAVFGQFRSKGLWNDVSAPAFDELGGQVEDGFVAILTHTNTSGVIYYTTDGSDPRAPGGAPAGTLYGGGIPVAHTVRIRARVVMGTDWSPEAEAVYILDLPTIAVSEIMYDPNGGSDFEFLELWNHGTNAIDLSLFYFDAGISFDFSTTPLTNLPAQAHLLIVNDLDDFASRYNTNGLVIAGEYVGKLANGGERITLAHDDLGRILSIEYNDSRGWPLPADGCGHSLVPLVFESQSAALEYGRNWRASAFIGGSPGAEDPAPSCDLLLNEIQAHTDYADPLNPEYDSNDGIEIYNGATSTVSLADWYLSDDADDLKKWAIPTDRSLVATSFMWFTEVDDFHNPITSGFGLDKSGERVYLSYLPGSSADRVVDAVRFKGQENGWSLGRYADGGDWWYHLESVTTNAANSVPGEHLVISEVMYHPAETTPHPGNNLNDEFVEIHNNTAFAADLWNTDGTWSLNGALDYSFPPATSLEPGAYLVVVGFDPVTNVSARADFLQTYGLTNGEVNLTGPWSGQLSNKGERIALEKPQAADPPDTEGSWVMVDEVIYYDAAPWPTGADGQGGSLARKNGVGSGNDPALWQLDVQGSPGKQMPRVWLIVPDDGAEFASPASGNVVAVIDPNNTSALIEVEFFFDSTNSLGVASNAPYQRSLGDVSTHGSHELMAVLTDDFGAQTSGVRQITVYTNVPMISGEGVRDRTIGINDEISLAGNLDLNGLPESLCSWSWSQVGGPGTVFFSDSASPDATASFSTGGVYQVQLVITYGNNSETSTVTFTVEDSNQPNTIRYEESFEAYANGISPVGMKGWYGNQGTTATVESNVYTYEGNYPLPAEDHKRVLMLDDTVSNLLSGTQMHTNIWVDMMVEMTYGQEDPQSLDEVTQGGQLAVSCNANGNLLIWHCPDPTNHPGANTWAVMEDVSVSESEMIRLTIHINYERYPLGFFRFRLFVNEAPVTNPSTWFACVDTNNNFLSSISFTGKTRLDDLVFDSVSTLGPWVIRASASAGGSILPAGNVTIETNSGTNFAMTASNYFHIARVLVDDTNNVGSVSNYLFTNVVRDHTIAVEFDEDLAASNTPHWWLALMDADFTNDFDAAELGDQDVDGMLTWQEYIAGTHPTNPASVFRIIQISAHDNDRSIHWLNAQDRLYSVYRSTNLSSVLSGTRITNGISADPSGTNTWVDSAADEGPAFYWLKVTTE